MLSLFLTFAFITSAESGCYQRRMCCRGRNVTCKDIDDGVGHLGKLDDHLEQKRHHQNSHRQTLSEDELYSNYLTPLYEASGDGYDLVYPDVYEGFSHQRIGKIVFPDVIELEGSGAEDIYYKYSSAEDIFEKTREKKFQKSIRRHRKTSPAPKITHLLFGYPQTPAKLPEDILRYTSRPKHLWIRYSVLDKFLPLTVSTSSPPSYSDEGPRIVYLEAPLTNCYCDEICVKLGDCCSDYTFVCPPRPCEVSNWGEWKGCVADNNVCGIGVDQRERHILQESKSGGAPCPPLKEMRSCFKLCFKQQSFDDLTTVALLLDYRHNETRSKTSRDNIYWDLPSNSMQIRETKNYCVKYEIGWVNRNCWNKQITKRLYRGNTVCAECQPEATLHRNNGRCASDLENGQQGFWKLIGPKSCNGIWTRISRDDNCRCSHNHSDLDSFLLV